MNTAATPTVRYGEAPKNANPPAESATKIDSVA